MSANTTPEASTARGWRGQLVQVAAIVGIVFLGKAGQGVPVGVGQPHLRMNQMTVGGTRV